MLLLATYGLLQELLRHDNSHGAMVNLKLQRRASQKLAIYLNSYFGSRLYANMATRFVAHMSDTVNITIKQAIDTEQKMPPMERADKRNIEQSVIGNSLRQLLHTSTVELTDTNSKAEQ